MSKRKQKKITSNDGATKRVEELSKLTGGMAHEIKNPLSTIKVNLKLISEDLKDLSFCESAGTDYDKRDQKFSRAFRKIEIVEKEANRLEQILDGFLRYVDGSGPRMAEVDINSFIAEMVDFYLPQAQNYSITIRQGLCRERLVCKADADMLKQVLLNLFINAQQAMSGGGELIIRTDRQQTDAVITISDTGSGIEAEKLPHIFDAYYSTRPQGSGLGLPTAKKIIQAHNGEIRVDSEVGKGTSFTLKLPLVVTAQKRKSDEQG